MQKAPRIRSQKNTAEKMIISKKPCLSQSEEENEFHGFQRKISCWGSRAVKHYNLKFKLMFLFIYEKGEIRFKRQFLCNNMDLTERPGNAVSSNNSKEPNHK